MSRFVKPETDTLTLANGDRLIVKRHLTCGESRAHLARLYVPSEGGLLRVNPLQIGIATVVAYLVDWTFTDDAGAPVPIRGLSPDDLQAVIDGLDAASFAEVREAIEAHELRMIAARQEKKPSPATGNGSEAISSSVN
jgi:hypothetical protein